MTDKKRDSTIPFSLFLATAGTRIKRKSKSVVRQGLFVARRKIPSIEDQFLLSRETFWNKRLARETKCLRKCHPEKKRQPAPYGEGPRVAIARAILDLFGLFARGLQNANSPVLRQLQFSFKTLPPAFDGFRILHISDFHFNDRPGFVEAACELIDGVHCDLLVLTGDYRFNRTASCRSVYTGMQRILKCVDPEFGAVAVLGNNDMTDFVNGFRGLGIRVLMNESIAVDIGGQSIWIAGVDDPHEFHCASLPLAVRDIPENAFAILLCHSPEIVKQAEQYGFDLYLCGHTHGGQICLPIIGPVRLNARCPRKLAAGKWKHKDMQGFTTTGIGASTVPIRFNCQPEAAIISLKTEKQRQSPAS